MGVFILLVCMFKKKIKIHILEDSLVVEQYIGALDVSVQEVFLVAVIKTLQ